MSADLKEAGGVEWCTTHHGIRNEDMNYCDMFDHGRRTDMEGCELHRLWFDSEVVDIVPVEVES